MLTARQSAKTTNEKQVVLDGRLFLNVGEAFGRSTPGVTRVVASVVPRASVASRPPAPTEG